MESQRAYKAPRNKISVISDKVKTFAFSKNSGTPNQRYSKDLSPITNNQFDFSSAIKEDYVKRGKSNELEKPMLSVIDDSVSKGTPHETTKENMDQLIVPKERKFSFMAHMSPPEPKETQKSLFQKSTTFIA